MLSRAIEGRSVIVVGAGLAGLTAAVELQRQGAHVIVVEAQSRVGGRVLTMRGAFAQSQHGEAGGDFIDDAQHEIRRVAQEYRLELRPVLRQGFSFVRHGERVRNPAAGASGERAWKRVATALAPWVRSYRLTEERWDSAFACAVGGQSVSHWLDAVHADADLRAVARSLRGFFLADPEDLGLLPVVDQFASDLPGQQPMYRIQGGNDQLPAAMAAELGEALRLNTIARAVRHDATSARLTVETATGEAAQLKADYLLFAIPATTLRAIAIRPALPSAQVQAIAELRYGRITKSLLQFDRRFWRQPGRARAFGTDAPTGAIWEANEEQEGKSGILTLMAGGQASEESQKLVAHKGVEGLVQSLKWLGAGGAVLLHSRLVTWENDPWAQGGYAYFDAGYDPRLRQWLARPYGRLLFAGEHTSIKWQGYMNGAVESGLRAAAEICALASLPGGLIRK
jgi:monoamine oxidase